MATAVHPAFTLPPRSLSSKAMGLQSPIMFPPPLDTPPLDNLQELLKRKREIEKNKTKLHLTEGDCNLLMTNADEFSYTDGQVIVNAGQEISSMYRLKYGKVKLMRDGKKVCELSQVNFIRLFLITVANGRGEAEWVFINIYAIGVVFRRDITPQQIIRRN